MTEVQICEGSIVTKCYFCCILASFNKDFLKCCTNFHTETNTAVLTCFLQNQGSGVSEIPVFPTLPVSTTSSIHAFTTEALEYSLIKIE